MTFSLCINYRIELFKSACQGTERAPFVEKTAFNLLSCLGETKAGLIVGLGGGGLAMFLYQFFKQVIIYITSKVNSVINFVSDAVQTHHHHHIFIYPRILE